MTIIAMLRLVSVPSALVEEIRSHARACCRCKSSALMLDSGGYAHPRALVDTRRCPLGSALVERCVNYEMAKRHPEGTR